MEVPINFLAVFACMVVNMAVGFAWYSMSLFGKPWMELTGRTKADVEASRKKGMAGNIMISLVMAFFMAYVLAHTTAFGIAYTKTDGIAGGLMSGFWTWLGFVLPVASGQALWDGKPWKLVAINSGYYLVVLLINAIILASWT